MMSFRHLVGFCSGGSGFGKPCGLYYVVKPGSVFAAYLRKGGAELWLVDKYKAHMDKIAADGLVFRKR